MSFTTESSDELSRFETDRLDCVTISLRRAAQKVAGPGAMGAVAHPRRVEKASELNSNANGNLLYETS